MDQTQHNSSIKHQNFALENVEADTPHDSGFVLGRLRQCRGKIRWNIIVAVMMFLSRLCFDAVMFNYSVLFIPIQDEFGASTLIAGWAGSLAIGASLLVSPPAASFGERYGFRKVYIAGVVVCCVSLLTSSFVPSLYWFFVTHGITYGIGHSMSVFAPIVFTLSCFHENRSGTVTGSLALARCGAIMAFAPVIERLNESVGWRNTLRIFMAVCLMVGLVSSTVLSPSFQILNRTYQQTEYRKVDEKDFDAVEKANKTLEEDGGDENLEGENMISANSGKVVDADVRRRDKHSKFLNRKEILSHYKEVACTPHLWLQGFGGTLTALGLVFFYVNAVSFFDSIGIDSTRSAFMVSMMGLSQLGGTSGATVFADRWPLSKPEVLALSTLVMATMQGVLTTTSSYSSVFACVVVTALASGMFNPIVYAAAVQTFGRSLQGTSCGLMSVFFSLGYSSGAVIGGYIYDLTGTYRTAFYVLLGCFLTASLLYATSAFLYRRKLREAAKDIASREQSDSVDGHPTTKMKGLAPSEKQDVFAKSTVDRA